VTDWFFAELLHLETNWYRFVPGSLCRHRSKRSSLVTVSETDSSDSKPVIEFIDVSVTGSACPKIRAVNRAYCQYVGDREM